MLASLMVNVQRSRDNFFTDSVFGQRNSSLYTHEGYYRDKGASQMNRWMHIASAVVEEDLIEVFIPYKVALEDSMLRSYARKHQIALDSLLQKPALQLKALSDFYRLQLDTLLLPPISYKMFYFEKYRQTGLLGFVDVSDLPRGEHHLQLLLYTGQPEKVANIWFYKKSRPALPE
jgi:hypothetical protein